MRGTLWGLGAAALEEASNVVDEPLYGREGFLHVLDAVAVLVEPVDVEVEGLAPCIKYE